jgi:hypothetical protein
VQDRVFRNVREPGVYPAPIPHEQQRGIAEGRIRVPVGTRKGAFNLHADAARRDWRIEGALFAGWDIHRVAGSSANPERLYA